MGQRTIFCAEFRHGGRTWLALREGSIVSIREFVVRGPREVLLSWGLGTWDAADGVVDLERFEDSPPGLSAAATRALRHKPLKRAEWLEERRFRPAGLPGLGVEIVDGPLHATVQASRPAPQQEDQKHAA